MTPVAGESRVQYGRASFEPAVEYFQARRYRPDFRPHAHESLALGVIEDGVGGNFWRGSREYSRAGQVVTINPDDVHTGFSAGPSLLSYSMLYLPDDVCGRYGGMRSGLRFASLSHSDGRIATLVRDLVAKLVDDAEPLVCSEALHLLLARAKRLEPAKDSPPAAAPAASQVRRIADYLEDSLDRRITIAELAALTGWGNDYLIRSFRRATGFTPHAWLVDRRLRRARSELSRGTPLSEASLSSGFADQSHMTRMFRSAYGVSPARFAREASRSQGR